MNRALWPILIGFVVWSLGFVALYGLQALGCYFGWDAATHRALLVGAYLLTLLVLAAILTVQIGSMRQPEHAAMPIKRIGIGTSIAALASAAIIFAPTLLISACH